MPGEVGIGRRPSGIRSRHVPLVGQVHLRAERARPSPHSSPQKRRVSMVRSAGNGMDTDGRSRTTPDSSDVRIHSGVARTEGDRS